MRKGLDYERKVSVVPIINVSLVVVLTLMLIAPFLSGSEQEVDLPWARASEVDDTDNVEITFTLDKEIFIGEAQVSLADLEMYLTPVFADAPHAVAVIKADKALLYGEVEALISHVEAAKAPRIALATKRRDGEGGS